MPKGHYKERIIIMTNTWLTKKIFLNAIKRNRIFLTKQNISRGRTIGYNLYIFYKNKMILIKGLSHHWSDFFESYRPRGTGYNKPQEIIESVGYSLGIKKLKEINYRVI